MHDLIANRIAVVCRVHPALQPGPWGSRSRDVYLPCGRNLLVCRGHLWLSDQALEITQLRHQSQATLSDRALGDSGRIYSDVSSSRRR